jgi:uncharacterized membrane protein YuzA (DUF378 family)
VHYSQFIGRIQSLCKIIDTLSKRTQGGRISPPFSKSCRERCRSATLPQPAQDLDHYTSTTEHSGQQPCPARIAKEFKQSQEEKTMKALNIIAAVLLIVGGLNWGLVGVAHFDLVAAIFGMKFGMTSMLSAVVYTLVGLAAVYQAATFSQRRN